MATAAAAAAATTGEVSHGRGGAGNMRPDDMQYVDGEVVRAGAEGSHGDGAYSSGRGGAGNIADVGTAAAQRRDKDLIPEAAYHPAHERQDYHTGRGGAGNEHASIDHERRAAERHRAEGAPVSLADKLKEKLFAVFRK